MSKFDPIPADGRIEITSICIPGGGWPSDYVGKILPEGTTAKKEPGAEGARFGSLAYYYNLSGLVLERYKKGDMFTNSFIRVSLE